jgi:hypothetical protein
VENETEEVCAPDGGLTKKNTVIAWIAEHCERAGRQSDATPQTKVHDALDAGGIMVSKTERASLLLEVGLRKKQDGRGLRFYEWRFTPGGAWVPLHVKSP